MRNSKKVYTELERARGELATKDFKYRNLSQSAASDSMGQYLGDQVKVLKGYVKALNWVLYK